MQRTTLKSLFRRGRFEKALRETRPFVQTRWLEPDRWTGGTFLTGTPDEDLAARLNFRIEREVVERPNGKEVARHRLVVPPPFRKNPGSDGKSRRSPLFNALQLTAYFAGPYNERHGLVVPPDAAIEVLLPKPKGGYRPIQIHSFLSRVLQRQLLYALQARTEMSATSHAYRQRHSRFTGLKQGAELVGAGYRYGVATDIVNFFPSVRAQWVEEAFRAMCPWASRQVRWLALSFMYTPVMRKPNHPLRRAGKARGFQLGTGTVPAGSVIGPFLSNIFAEHFLDRPFALAMAERAKLVRYSDNLFLLAKTRTDAGTALHLVEDLLARVDLQLHADDASRLVRDLTIAPAMFLGKRLHGGAVQTPEDVIQQFARELTETDPALHAFKSLAMMVCDELILDRPRAMEFLRRSLGRTSNMQLRCFDGIRAVWLKRRGIEVPEDPALDQEDYDQADVEAHNQEVNDQNNKTCTNEVETA